MRTILAFLLDAYREAVHSKMFQILGILTGVFLFALLSIGYQEGSMTEGVERMVADLGMKAEVKEVKELSRTRQRTRFEATLALSDADAYLRALGNMIAEEHRRRTGDIFSGVAIRIEGEGEAKRLRVEVGSGPRRKEFEIGEETVDLELKNAIEPKLKRAGIRGAGLEVVATESWVKTIRVTGESSTFHLSRGGEISILFGAWSFRPPWDYGIAWFVFALQSAIVEWIACFFGVIFSLIVTAGMLPNLIRRGTVEFWLSKPVDRVRVILFKFVGGILFVLPLAAALIGGSFLILSLRTGHWNFWFLAALGVFVVYYGVLHAMSMLFGLWTRSTVAAIFLTLMMWVLSSLAFLVRVVVHELPAGERPGWLVAAVDGLSYLLPRTSESKEMAQYLMGRGLEIELADLVGGRMAVMSSFSFAESMLQCGLYTVLVLVLCAWTFQRRDF
jgi:ABC-type transport system involved in multi-copper enzyme maturation permease subunit